MNDTRLNEIIKEAITTQTISRITSDERKYLSDLYFKLTGEKVNQNCNACIIRICYKINSVNIENHGSNTKQNRRKSK